MLQPVMELNDGQTVETYVGQVSLETDWFSGTDMKIGKQRPYVMQNQLGFNVVRHHETKEDLSCRPFPGDDPMLI